VAGVRAVQAGGVTLERTLIEGFRAPLAPTEPNPGAPVGFGVYALRTSTIAIVDSVIRDNAEGVEISDGTGVQRVSSTCRTSRTLGWVSGARYTLERSDVVGNDGGVTVNVGESTLVLQDCNLAAESTALHVAAWSADRVTIRHNNLPGQPDDWRVRYWVATPQRPNRPLALDLTDNYWMTEPSVLENCALPTLEPTAPRAFAAGPTAPYGL
jgi:hypothetical protein